MNSKTKTIKCWLTFSSAALFFLSGVELRAQSGDTFLPFDRFLSATTAAVYNSVSMPKVANAAAFAEMRQYILTMYQGAQVPHSFAQGLQIYDCMPIEQQPALRLHNLKGLAAVPPASAGPATGATGATPGREQPGQAAASSIRPASGVDRFGNTVGCQDKTVPIGRLTLEQLTQFPTLKAFLNKSPDGSGKPPIPTAPTAGSAAPCQYRLKIPHSAGRKVVHLAEMKVLQFQPAG